MNTLLECIGMPHGRFAQGTGDDRTDEAAQLAFSAGHQAPAGLPISWSKDPLMLTSVYLNVGHTCNLYQLYLLVSYVFRCIEPIAY